MCDKAASMAPFAELLSILSELLSILFTEDSWRGEEDERMEIASLKSPENNNKLLLQNIWSSHKFIRSVERKQTTSWFKCFEGPFILGISHWHELFQEWEEGIMWRTVAVTKRVHMMKGEGRKMKKRNQTKEN